MQVLSYIILGAITFAIGYYVAYNKYTSVRGTSNRRGGSNDDRKPTPKFDD